MIKDLASVEAAIPALLADYTPADVSLPLNVLHLALNTPIAAGKGAAQATTATMQGYVQVDFYM